MNVDSKSKKECITTESLACIEEFNPHAKDDVIVQGETYIRYLYLLDSEPIEVINIDIGTEQTAKITTSLFMCLEIDDKVVLLNTCESDLCTDRNCFTVIDVEHIISEHITIITVKEPIVGSCYKLDILCTETTMMLAKALNVCSCGVDGVVVNNYRYDNDILYVSTVKGSNDIITTIDTDISLYDLLSIPKAGIYDAEIKNIETYEDKKIITLYEGFVPKISNNCLPAKRRVGIIAKMRCKNICGGYLLYINKYSELVDIGTPIKPNWVNFRGTLDIKPSGVEQESQNLRLHYRKPNSDSELNKIGRYIITINLLTQDDIQNDIILLEGDMYLRQTNIT